MQKRKYPFVLCAALAAAMWGGAAPLRAENDWQIIKVANRDYLTLDNIARFYALHPVPSLTDNHPVFTDGHSQIELSNDLHEVAINGVKQWLSFPVLYQNGQPLISRFDLAKTIEPTLRPTMIENLVPFHTVVLDAGHGGLDRGARSASGFEKDYTLDVIRDLRSTLVAKGFKVVLTRSDDTYLPLESRAEAANDVADSIMVSVHFNFSGDGAASANGFEVYSMTPRGAASTADTAMSLEQIKEMPGNAYDNESLALATCVHHSLLGHIPQADRGVKRARFAVLRLTHAPAVLVEGGFLTNPGESQRINDPAWRQRLAEAIATGVQSFQALCERHRPPKLLADYRGEQLPLAGTMVDPAALAARNQPPGLLVPVSNPAPQSAPLPAPPGAGTLAPASAATPVPTTAGAPAIPAP